MLLELFVPTYSNTLARAVTRLVTESYAAWSLGITGCLIGVRCAE